MYYNRGMSVLHHLHTRKRREPYPASAYKLRVLDGVVYVVGILGPFATIPQLVQIYTTHSAVGVSVLSWGTYAVFDIPFIIYATVHKEKPLMVCYWLWLFFNCAVAFGAVLYG